MSNRLHTVWTLRCIRYQEAQFTFHKTFYFTFKLQAVPIRNISRGALHTVKTERQYYSTYMHTSLAIHPCISQNLRRHTQSLTKEMQTFLVIGESAQAFVNLLSHCFGHQPNVTNTDEPALDWLVNQELKLQAQVPTIPAGIKVHILLHLWM